MNKRTDLASNYLRTLAKFGVKGLALTNMELSKPYIVYNDSNIIYC